MEKDVTSLDFGSMIGDILYKILSFVNIILIAHYTVRESGFIFVVLTFVLMMILKTFVGLFNYSIWADFAQYYIDLIMNGLIGISMGFVFKGYLVNFNNMDWFPIILMIGISMLLYIVRGNLKVHRTYIELLK